MPVVLPVAGLASGAGGGADPLLSRTGQPECGLNRQADSAGLQLMLVASPAASVAAAPAATTAEHHLGILHAAQAFKRKVCLQL